MRSHLVADVNMGWNSWESVKATDCRVEDSEKFRVDVQAFSYLVPAKMWDQWAARYNMDDVVLGVCQVKWIQRGRVGAIGRTEKSPRVGSGHQWCLDFGDVTRVWVKWI